MLHKVTLQTVWEQAHSDDRQYVHPEPFVMQSQYLCYHWNYAGSNHDSPPAYEMPLDLKPCKVILIRNACRVSYQDANIDEHLQQQQAVANVGQH